MGAPVLSLGRKTFSKEAALMTGARVSVSPSYAATKAAITATPASGCGAEPARRPADASGVSRFVDPVAGQTYNDCLVAQALAATNAKIAKIDAGQAGGAYGCGLKPPSAVGANGVAVYLGSEAEKLVGAAYDRCVQQRAPSGASAPAPSAPPAGSAPLAFYQAPPATAPAPVASVPGPIAPYAPTSGGYGADVATQAPVYERSAPSSSTSGPSAGPELVKDAPSPAKSSTGVAVAVGGVGLALGLGLFLVLR